MSSGITASTARLGGLDLQSLASLRMAMASRMRFSVSPQVRTVGIVDGRQAFATLSQTKQYFALGLGRGDGRKAPKSL